MIDTHCHLDFPEILPQLPQVLAAAKQAGVQQFIIPATGENNWQLISELSAQYPEIHPAYGIHPWFLKGVAELTTLADWLETHTCIAIGECGLDFYHGREDESLQKQVLAFQLDLAYAHQLPVILHSRKAVAEVLQLCQAQQVSQGVFHGFAGSIEQAEQLMAAGFYLGVGGVICREQARKIRAMVAQLPLDRILLETDSPSVGKEQHGTPEDIVPIAHALAALHGVSFETVMVQCAANARSCFGADFESKD